MGIAELFLLAVGLSMDAFAVSVCKGLAMEKCSLKKASICGIWFGGFQGLMPAIGFLLGYQFKDYITSFDHWIAFILLAVIGGNMIKESFEKGDGCECGCGCSCEDTDDSMDVKTMFLMAVATSIDALAVGVTFAFLPDTNIVAAVIFIGCITFVLSTIGAKVGNVFGARYKSRAEFAGGAILMLIGLKILLEHLGILF